jgi:hypothetical protein
MKPIAVVIAVVALVVGVGVGYMVWGSQASQLEADIARAKARLAEAQQAGVREGTMATKLQEIEAQIKKAGDDLKVEQEAKDKLEKVAAALEAKKKKK